MKKGPITRGQASKDPDLNAEVNYFNPFENKPKIPRDSDFPASEEGKSAVVHSPAAPPITSKTRGSDTSSIVDSITPSFQSLTLNMANPAAAINIQTITLKDALSMVPEYDGKNIPLSLFLEGCDEAKAMIDANSEPNLARFLRSKIIGEARQTIAGQDFSTVESLKDYLKQIYSPCKTVQQLLGEMGNEYQKDNESVISFANRVREIGRKILEAEKIRNNRIDDAFKASVEANIIDCFKRGLRLEIEQRIDAANDILDIVKKAVAVERQLEARKALRKGEAKPQQNRFKNTFTICGLCKEEGHEMQSCKKRTRICDYCSKPGHIKDQCFQLAKDKQKQQLSCQLCGGRGHTALQCSRNTLCQLCNKPGHSASRCISNRATVPAVTCQICQKTGHSANKCFRLNSIRQQNPQIEARAKLTCQLCNHVGHTAATCSNQRSMQPAATVECQYCKNKGHVISDCLKLKFKKSQEAKNGQGHQEASTAKVTTIESQRCSLEIDDLLGELMP